MDSSEECPLIMTKEASEKFFKRLAVMVDVDA